LNAIAPLDWRYTAINDEWGHHILWNGVRDGGAASAPQRPFW